ncbi:MAG: hypothetical protein ACOY3J_03125 [Bacillota bacterium]|uniref:hypothetical protein n=1 Tax=Thermanaerosceptrum fracticalcis TaxID=1712410 RepID=UPI001A9BF332|nr:hypothetical protein [Thermanaerosceptrum fracticalcis]
MELGPKAFPRAFGRGVWCPLLFLNLDGGSHCQSSAVSLPNMLVISSVIGTKKTLVYVALVIVMAAVGGKLFGAMV